MNNLKYKKFLTTALVGSLLVSVPGCGKTQNIKSSNPTSEPEVTTEAVSEEDILMEEINNKAQSSYETYSEFYENAGVTIEDVEIMANVINDKLDGYNESQIKSATNLIRQSILSDNLMQAIDNSNFKNKKIKKVISSPRMSELIVDSNVNPIITRYEELRDELAQELSETKTYSEKTAKKIRKTTIYMETDEYDEDNGKMRSENALDESGKLYVLASVKYEMTNLCRMVSPNKIYIGSGEKKLKINYTNEEIEVNSLVESYKSDNLQIPEDLYKKYDKARRSTIGTNYLDDLCTFADQLLTEAGNSKISKADLINKKKKLLEIQKSELMLSASDEKNNYSYRM